MKNSIVLLAMTLMMTSMNGFAAESAANVSSASESSTYSDILDHAYVNLFSIYHGQSMNNLSSPYALDHKGKEAHTSFNTINFDSTLDTDYMITKDIGIGPNIPFLYVPVQGQGMILGDVGIRAFNRHLINWNGVKVAGDFYLQSDSGLADRSRGMKAGLKSTPAIRYEIPNSRFTVGSWNEVKYYAGVFAGKTFKLWTLPYVKYDLNRSVALNFGIEMETDHLKNDATFNFTSYETDLQPGFIWNINSKLMINPFFQIFTNNAVTSDRTAVGAVMNARFL